MRDVFELVRKNFKNLIRSKVGSLVVILGPLIVIFLAGLAFDNSNVYAVKVGAYRPDNVALTGQMLDELREQFSVTEYRSEKECVDAIKNAEVHTCMAFSPGFSVGVPGKNRVLFYVDYSRMNLVYALMKVMTEEVGEQSLQESQNLTKLLLDTIDFTQKRVQDERALLVQVTTQNEVLNQNVQDLLVELGDLNLEFDERLSVDELQKSKTQVKQWTENALTLGNKGLSKATSFIDAAGGLVKSSSASQDTKNSLIVSFKKSVDEIKALEADMASTTNLTRGAFSEFDAKMEKLIVGIQDTKSILSSADTSREFSVRVLDSMRLLLDQSLLSVLHVQQALNDIDERVGAIEIRDAEGIAQPIVTSIKPVVQQRTYLNYLFPVLIVLVVMFTALLMTPTLILLDRNSPAAFRSFLTPVSEASVVLASFITSFILVFVQLIVMLAIVSVFFSPDIVSNVPGALLVLGLASSVFVLLGMLIGYSFKYEETATLVAVSLGAVFLFISDVIIPLESMPEAFSYIAGFNPYVLGSQLLRRVLLFDVSLLSVLPELLLVAGYVVALALLVMGVYVLTRRYSLQEFLRDVRPVIERIRHRKK